MARKITAYCSYQDYLKSRPVTLEPVRKKKAVPAPVVNPLLDKLCGMIGKTYLHNGFWRKVEGFELTQEEVRVNTDFKTITLPLDGALEILQQDFKPILR